MRLQALSFIGALAVTAIPLSAGAQSLPANDQPVPNAVVPIEIARRQRHKEEDQTADDRKRAPQHAPPGLVATLVISMVDMVIFAFRRQRLYSELPWRTILRGRRQRLYSELPWRTILRARRSQHHRKL